MPYWIKRAREHNFVGLDVNKFTKKEVAELGGLVVVFNIVMGILFYIASQVFVYQNYDKITPLLAAVSSIFIAMIIGLIDDLLGWKIGLRQRQKPMISILIALPMIVINSGVHIMNLPFIGHYDFKIFYPLLLVPIGIVGAANGFNMVAGFNGLEAGLGIIIIGTLGYVAFLANEIPATIVAACTVTALLAFFFYNKYPARVFPGNTLTYSVGTIIAIVAILGNVEKLALFIFIPYYIEFFLKLRGKMEKESFAKPLKDGSITNQYDKWYGIEHVIISFLERVKGKATEEELVLLLFAVQGVTAIFTVIMFFNS